MDMRISVENSFSLLKSLALDMKKIHGHVVDVSFSRLQNSQFICDAMQRISILNKGSIRVDISRLEDSFDDDTFDFSELVLCVRDFYHESRHFEQEYDFYKRENPSNDILFMAQMRYTALALPEFKRMAEFRLPSEVDAELYGWLHTVEYFDKQGIDVRDILYQDVVHRREHKYGWYGDLNAWDYNSAVQSLKDNLDYLKYHKMDFVNYSWESVKNWKGETNSFQKFKSKGFADAYNRAESVSESLHVLFIFATKQEKARVCHFSCLKSSVKEGKQDYRCKRADRLDGLKDHNLFKYIEQDELDQTIVEQQDDGLSF